MDLSNLNVVEKANKGSVLELKNPMDHTDKKGVFHEKGDILTDEGEKCADNKNIKPLYLRLLGSDSNVYRTSIKRRFERSQNKKNQKLDLDDVQLKAAELLAKCTTECYLIEDGKAVECTIAEMTRLYMKYPWLREQAEEHMSDRSALMES